MLISNTDFYNRSLFSACQKEVSQTSSNNEIIAKVNSWLDSQKPSNKVTQSANIEL